MLGNRTADANLQGAWEYNKNNILNKNPKAEYNYDTNGDVIQQITENKQINYVYDGQKRLIQVDISDSETSTIKYAYDAENRRVKKEINGEVTWYLYNPQGLIAELDQTGNIKVAYGWKSNRRWGTNLFFQKRNNQVYWYHIDYVGTPKMMTDITGNVVWEAKSEVYGKTTVTTATIENNLRFPGQYHDEETGLHYNYHRYYDPEIGRYLQQDPIGLQGGLNMYAYVDSNPIIYIDGNL